MFQKFTIACLALTKTYGDGGMGDGGFLNAILDYQCQKGELFPLNLQLSNHKLLDEDAKLNLLSVWPGWGPRRSSDCTRPRPRSRSSRSCRAAPPPPSPGSQSWRAAGRGTWRSSHNTSWTHCTLIRWIAINRNIVFVFIWNISLQFIPSKFPHQEGQDHQPLSKLCL